MKITIRPMSREDKPRLTRILHGVPQFKPFEVTVAEELIDSYLHDPVHSGYHILVAEADSTTVGYVCYGPTPLTEGTWDVYWLVVAQERQGQGIGTALMKSAEKEMGKAKGRLVIIETSSAPGYEKARRFYINHGYEIVARIADFYAPGDDKLILRKRLRRNRRQLSSKAHPVSSAKN